ncbi:MAG TPA: alpha/beta fold hydrolase [Candidatus Limnocylindrales bacterium]
MTSRPGPLPVVFLPGGVTPVALSYAPLLEELGEEISPLLKDLEVYAGDEPPADYSIQLEVDALERAVDAAGLDTFHLVGYSGGGAVSLDFAAQHAERLRSLAIYEPARQPGPLVLADHPEYQSAGGQLGPEEMMAAFTSLQLRPGVEPPPPPQGPAPGWMAKRPDGLRAMMRAFEAYATDPELLRRCACPVYLAYGLLTHEGMVRRIQVLAGLFPDLWIEAYPGLHHFGPPQRSRPAHYASSLRHLWSRAEAERGGARGGDDAYAA